MPFAAMKGVGNPSNNRRSRGHGVRTNQGSRDDSLSSASQKFVHTVAMIVGVLFGSATAFAVPELLGVESLPQAVESLQAFAERVRQRPAPVEDRSERVPAAAPIALKPTEAPAMAKAEIGDDARVVVPVSEALQQMAARNRLPAIAPLPVVAVAERDALPVIPSPPLAPEPPVTSSIPIAPAAVSLAPSEFVAAAANRPGDALVASVAILSSDVSSAMPLIELKVELPSAAEVPLPRARPDDIPGPSPAERLALIGAARVKAEHCLAQAIYFEARDQPLRGQSAVAQVVVNRVFSPHYPKDVCGVVYQNAHRHLACQFTFACDGKPETIRERGAWARAQRIAKQTLDGKVWLPEVAKSTHYHASYVRPRWVREMKTMVRHGVHTFYRPRRWGDGSNEPSWGVASNKKNKS